MDREIKISDDDFQAKDRPTEIQYKGPEQGVDCVLKFIIGFKSPL